MSKPVELGQYDIIELWEQGVLNDLSFIYLALSHQGLDQPVHFDDFIEKWRGQEDPDTGRVKKLTIRKLKVAIATLEAKEIITDHAKQLTLSFAE